MLTYKEPGNIESKILAPFLLVCFGLFGDFFFKIVLEIIHMISFV